jgi:hypothetical protein
MRLRGACGSRPPDHGRLPGKAGAGAAGRGPWGSPSGSVLKVSWSKQPASAKASDKLRLATQHDRTPGARMRARAIELS